jgi:hypothetical protein
MAPRRTVTLKSPPPIVPTRIMRDRRRTVHRPQPSADVRVNDLDLAEALRIAEAVFLAGRPSTPEADG